MDELAVEIWFSMLDRLTALILIPLVTVVNPFVKVAIFAVLLSMETLCAFTLLNNVVISLALAVIWLCKFATSVISFAAMDAIFDAFVDMLACNVETSDNSLAT